MLQPHLDMREKDLALHRLATVGMALSADIHLGNVTLVALAAVGDVAVDGVVGIVITQAGCLLGEGFPAAAMAAQALLGIDIVASAQLEIFHVVAAGDLSMSLRSLGGQIGFVTVQATQIGFGVNRSQTGASGGIGAFEVLQMLVHGVVAQGATEVGGGVPGVHADGSHHDNGQNNGEGHALFAHGFLGSFFFSHDLFPLCCMLAGNVTEGHATADGRTKDVTRVITAEEAT